MWERERKGGETKERGEKGIDELILKNYCF